MDIKNLISFQTILDTGSYSLAAKKLGYTQSAITSHIQKLEKEVGGQIFYLRNRKIHLSSLGKDLIPLAEDLLFNYHQIVTLSNNKEIKGDLKIAAPESLTVSVMGKILKKFSSEYPEVNIVLTNGPCGENQSELLSGRVDVAFMIYPEIKIDNCEQYLLEKENIVIVTNSKDYISFESYCESENVQFITNEKDCSYRVMFEKSSDYREIESTVKTMELWSIEAIKNLVLNDMGFGVLPQITVQEQIEEGTLQVLDHKNPFPDFYSHMIVKQKKQQFPVVNAFIETVNTFFKEKNQT